jgi:hypothetical protein
MNRRKARARPSSRRLRAKGMVRGALHPDDTPGQEGQDMTAPDELRGLLPDAEIDALAALLAEAEEGARDPAVRRRWAREEARQRAIEQMARRRLGEIARWHSP